MMQETQRTSPDARIVLVRHSPSAHVTKPGWLNRGDVEQWRDAYDLEGIERHSQPPSHLVQLAADATLFVSSDLTRAIVSAERVANGQPVIRSPTNGWQAAGRFNGYQPWSAWVFAPSAR